MTCLQKFTKLIFTKFTPTSAVNKLHVKIRGNKFHELQIFPRNSRNLLSSNKTRHTVSSKPLIALQCKIKLRSDPKLFILNSLEYCRTLFHQTVENQLGVVHFVVTPKLEILEANFFINTGPILLLSRQVPKCIPEKGYNK